MIVSWAGSDPVAVAGAGLLAALIDALAATPTGLPDRVFLAPGGSNVAWDGTQAWVRLLNIRQGLPFGPPTKAVLQWNTQWEIAVLRCVHKVENIGGQMVIPTQEEITEDAGVLLADMRALRAVVDVLSPYRRGQTIGDIVQTGPMGGLAGTQVQLTVPLQDCRAVVVDECAVTVVDNDDGTGTVSVADRCAVTLVDNNDGTGTIVGSGPSAAFVDNGDGTGTVTVT